MGVVLHVTIAYVTSSRHDDYNCGVILHICTIRYNTLHNIGVLKVVNLHCSRQQCVVVEWSGRSITVRVRVTARAREWEISLLFLLKCDKELCCGMVQHEE